MICLAQRNPQDTPVFQQIYHLQILQLQHNQLFWFFFLFSSSFKCSCVVIILYHVFLFFLCHSFCLFLWIPPCSVFFFCRYFITTHQFWTWFRWLICQTCPAFWCPTLSLNCILILRMSICVHMCVCKNIKTNLKKGGRCLLIRCLTKKWMD